MNKQGLFLAVAVLGVLYTASPALARDATSYQPAAVTRISSVPVGTIMAWPKNSMPADGTWAECDGRNGTPDLRGRFIRGLGGRSAGLGQVQTDDTRSHTHVVHVGSQTVTGTAAGQRYIDAHTGVSLGSVIGQRHGDVVTDVSVTGEKVSFSQAKSTLSTKLDMSNTRTAQSSNVTGKTSGGTYTTEATGGSETRPENVALKYIMKIR